VETVREDFDRIARLLADRADGLDASEARLLARVPAGAANVLDVGCGTGAAVRVLAARARHVVGIDLSPEMIRLARTRGADLGNVELHQADFLTWSRHDRFDAVVSLATLHHMPFEPALQRMADALRPGGRLLVLDLVRGGVLYDVASAASRLRLRRRARPDPELAAAWAAHGAHETYLTIGEVRARASAIVPGARIRRHLGWRYSIDWVRAG
jgi:SAM-dependent methyltransferase